MHISHAYVCLYVSEINDNNDARDKRKELELFCYYKLLILPMKRYSLTRRNLD